MKPLYFHKRLFSVTLSCRDTGNAALPTCEDEIKDQYLFILSRVPPVNDVTDLATTFAISKTGRLPDRYITRMKAKRLGWSGKETESLWVLNPPIKMDWRR
jgi:hypothetical protein